MKFIESSRTYDSFAGNNIQETEAAPMTTDNLESITIPVTNDYLRHPFSGEQLNLYTLPDLIKPNTELQNKLLEFLETRVKPNVT